jgi:uncharacterized membrane protein YbhN (UPF0104 family)
VTVEVGSRARIRAVARGRALRLALTISFYVALVAFLGLYLASIDYSVLATIRPAWGWLIVASVTGLAFRLWQVHIWTTMLRGLGATDVRLTPALVDVYATSWLGRYIPGTAPWILGKIFFASKHGISKARLAVSSVLEAAIQVAVLLALSSLMLLFDPRLAVLAPWLRVAMAAAVVACVVGLLAPVFNRGMALLFRIARRGTLAAENRASGRTILIAAGQNVVGALLTGASLFFAAKAVWPQLGFDDFGYVAASSNVASAVSMFAVFAPAGIGVREGVQLALLNAIVPAAVTVVIVVLTRAWATVMDVLFFAIGRVAVRIDRQRTTHSQHSA